MVVRPVHGYVFLARLSVPELPWKGKPAFAHKLHGTVHGCVPHPWRLSFDSFKEFVETYVRGGLKKGLSNEVTLLCGLKPLLFKA